MPMVDFESLTRPVAADDPCGRDLDLLGDAAYLNFMASSEGLLPSTYFVRDKSGNERPFDPTAVDFKRQFEAAKPFLLRTRDLRQLVILAKFSMLDRDLAGFIVCIRAVSALLTDHWDEVHPRAEDGDFGLRLGALESIDSASTVVMPLQFFPLVETRRLGPVSYRSYLLATGETAPREDETVVQLPDLEKILGNPDGGPDLRALIERRQQLMDLQSGLNQIAQTWREKSGEDLSLERLPTVVGGMVAFLDATVARLDPSAALVPQAGAGGPAEAVADQETAAAGAASGRIASAADAAAALAAVADYFSRSEPSNPALLLVRQASQLIGKSFLEVMQILVPTHLEQAAINIGKDQFFDLPIARLSTLPSEPPEPQERVVNVDDSPSSGHVFKAQNRVEALDMLDQAGRYFRAAEPSSPIPFVIERARDLGQRDFLSVLRAVLPADALKTHEKKS
jgi:type VI secretion system protein ImpA